MRFYLLGALADIAARGLLRAAELMRDVEEWLTTDHRWSAIRARRAFLTEHILRDPEAT
jgi:hypothetical protein